MQIRVLSKRAAVLTTTSLLLSLYVPSLASQELDIHIFCADYPFNSRCKGYQRPIPLEQRSGDEGACWLTSIKTKLSGNCKVVLTDQKITIYLEDGEPINFLNGQKATKEISIALSDVVKLAYKEKEKSDRLRNTLLFGVLGAALTRTRKLSEIEIGFHEKTEEQQAGQNNLTLLTKRDAGAALKEKLEKLTGINQEMKPEPASETKQ